MVPTDVLAPWEGAGLADELAAIAEALQRSTVQVRGHRMGSGSGIIWPGRPERGSDSAGLIVTNAHVVHSPTATVELWDGRTLEAEVISADRERDLAALAVEPNGLLPTAEVADSDSLRVGQLVLAVGNPLGLSGALTSGIVHSIERTPSRGMFGRNGIDWVRADVRLAPGNSGGPLADARGRVIGINSMIAGGLGLAVPSNAVTRFLGGRGARQRIGITVQPVLVPLQRRRLPGLLLIDVAADSPAERAGLMIGDIVVGATGRLFENPSDFARALDGLSDGGTLHLDLLRGGRLIRREVMGNGEAPRGYPATGEAA